MRLLYSFRFKRIGDTWLADAVGQNAHLFQGILQLNEVGHFIVSELKNMTEETSVTSTEQAELTEKDIVLELTKRLTNEYAVGDTTAQSAVQQVLNYLKAEQVLG